jgi:acyl-CoA synthetase (NDP forming)
MSLARFSDKTMSRLRRNLPSGIVDTKNPVDTTPAIDTIHYGKCVKNIIEDENTDCVLISNVASTFTQENLPPGPDHREDIANPDSHPKTLIRLVNGTKKPVAVSMNGGDIYHPAVRMMEENGVCVFRKIDRAIKAMGRFVEANLARGR